MRKWPKMKPNALYAAAIDSATFVEHHGGHDLAAHLAERVAEVAGVDAFKGIKMRKVFLTTTLCLGPVLPDFSCYIIPKRGKIYQITIKCTEWL
jgi:hypothetical protein